METKEMPDGTEKVSISFDELEGMIEKVKKDLNVKTTHEKLEDFLNSKDRKSSITFTYDEAEALGYSMTTMLDELNDAAELMSKCQDEMNKELSKRHGLQ